MASPKPWKVRTHWSIAVYWVREREYGKATTVDGWEEAIEKAENKISRGFGKEGISEIHVTRTHLRKWKFISRTTEQESQSAPDDESTTPKGAAT